MKNSVVSIDTRTITASKPQRGFVSKPRVARRRRATLGNYRRVEFQP